ncbi:MAG: ATP-binding cassette domain-containing protein, partial [Methylomarinum sp.]|nr:ATP-binding cassette domain-containing protein [Methylomarinum sp.]
MPIIEVNHLTKEYQLGHLTNLKETTLNALKRMTFQAAQERKRFKALDDVNFHIEEGEVVGIIGHNGAGKSTLLKHLANISKPTKGEVIVRGSVAPLIEVGAGVNPELTGRENIFLNAAILGIPKKIIRQKLDEIIDFSELEQFIDTPVKRYSSGMQVKLGFSIATTMDADILIVDEVLAVGDLAFQRKCFDRMEHSIKQQGKTVLIVSHNIRQIERLCNRVILLNQGRILEDDKPNQVCNTFYHLMDNQIIKQNSKSNTSQFKRVESSNEVELIGVTILDKK